MALDILTSFRATAVVALVSASFTSPIVLKSTAFANASAKLTGSASVVRQEPSEALVAGGVEFAMPQSWGRLGSSTASSHGSASARIGTVVSGLCPGGAEGASCTDDVQVTFIAYSGAAGHELPELKAFRTKLDAELPAQFHGFTAGGARMRAGADRIAYLDYSFTWREGRAVHHQRLAAYRHAGGSGVVAMATGAKLGQHAKAIDAFLASAHEPSSES